ncbi:MAG: hypothetical protein DSZ03_04750 [Sulfurimonas sp.]|nr:MAG: hypothetical protein DSZ03_04750 [Sulfurimonas sp.]
MKHYHSDGKKLLHVAYDDHPGVGDLIDGMHILSTHTRESDLALFFQEDSGQIGVYVLDDNYIVGRVFGFDTLVDAVNAWMTDEV